MARAGLAESRKIPTQRTDTAQSRERNRKPARNTMDRGSYRRCFISYPAKRDHHEKCGTESDRPFGVEH